MNTTPFLAQGGGWLKPNMAYPFLARGLFYGANELSTIKQTWQTVQFQRFFNLNFFHFRVLKNSVSIRYAIYGT